MVDFLFHEPSYKISEYRNEMPFFPIQIVVFMSKEPFEAFEVEQTGDENIQLKPAQKLININ